MISKFTLPLIMLCASQLTAAETNIFDTDISTAAVQKDVNFACSFASECVDTETCSDTTFAGDLVGKSGGPTADDLVVGVSLKSDALEQVLIGTVLKETYKLMNIMENGSHLMTIASDGTSFYSIHFPEVPMAITYHGTCEEVQ